MYHVDRNRLTSGSSLLALLALAGAVSTAYSDSPPGGATPHPAKLEPVYAIVTAKIRPGKYVEAMKYIKEEQTLGRVHLLYSYQIQFGDSNQIVDIWEAPDYGTLTAAFFPEAEIMHSAEGEIFEYFNIRTAIRNPVGVDR